MSKFTTPLVVEAQDDGKTWKLAQEFDYNMGDEGGVQIDVPQGFVTDFASVPQIFWNVLPPWGAYGKAAVLHDWLYHEQTYTRAKTDKIFLEAMTVLGVSALRKYVIYAGVRLGGWKAWNEHAKENKGAA